MTNSSRSFECSMGKIFVRNLNIINSDVLRCSCFSLEDFEEPSVRGLKSSLFSSDISNLRDHSFITCNGKLLRDEDPLRHDHEYSIHLRVLGGKGGFGSLLRSFGSQISKNRNQDACRDLSGRRLRNVKAEKRLKELVDKQAEKDKEKQKKKEEKIEKLRSTLRAKPKSTFDNPEYEADRSRMPEMVFSAVEEGLKVQSEASSKTVESEASCSKTVEILEEHVVTVEKKRKHVDPLEANVGSKKMKGWLGVDDSSSDDES